MTPFLKNIKKTSNFISQHFTILLILTVLISYGQMLWMYPWQDDNALFFKLAHIAEPAGYFSPGVIGTDPITKYAAAPFYPIYLLFGHNTIAYFAFLWLLYLITTLVVYKTFSVILGKIGGRVAGFIFAAGYVSSDGLWRMANSATTSFGLIFATLTFLSYWQFYKKKNWLWYISALIFFYLAQEIAIVRTHYLFSIILLFEIFFLFFGRLPFSIIASLLRMLPFLYIFKNFSLTASASRSGQLQEFVLAFTKFDFSQYYGFFSSITNLIIPDWLTNYVINLQINLDDMFGTHLPMLRLILLFLPILAAILILKNHRWRKVLIPLFLIISTAWSFLSKDLIMPMFIDITLGQYFIAALGVELLFLGLIIFISLNNNRWLFLLLMFWILINLSVYSAYNPTFQYSTIERYLTHSFLPATGLWALLFISLSKKTNLNKSLKILIILLGVGNIANSIFYQQNILKSRSFPARNFYTDLKKITPVIKKGDILYFDVARDSQRYYNDAISTAMMPETTSFAWRYGIDRYDIKLTTDFNELLKIIKSNQVPLENIHTFWYDQHSLLDTREQIKDFLQENYNATQIIIESFQKSVYELEKGKEGSIWSQNDLDIHLKNPIDTSAPRELIINLIAEPLISNVNYPLMARFLNLNEIERKFWGNFELRNLSLEYKIFKENILQNSKYTASSYWQRNFVDNLHDGDVESLWQSERTGWGRDYTFIQMELPRVLNINKAVWVNGYSSNTPTDFSIEISVDGRKWQEVGRVKSLPMIDKREPQTVNFDPVDAKFIKMIFHETANGDSPVIAEFWVTSSKFLSLDLGLTEKFLQHPFIFVPNRLILEQNLNILQNKGKVQIAWKNNKSHSWQFIKQTEFEIYYDGRPHQYHVIIPAGGRDLTDLKITNISTPGTIYLKNIQVKYPTWKTLGIDIDKNNN